MSYLEMNATETEHPGEAVAESEVLRLTWAVIDGVATDVDRRRLQELVANQYRARDEYIQAVRLDGELSDLLNPHSTSEPRNPTSRSAVRSGDPAGRRPIVPTHVAPPMQAVRMTG